MRIYTKVVIDLQTMETVETEGFDYDGPVAECKGSSTNTVDPVYNARMARVAERQQNMAEEYFNFWQETYQPMEKAQVEAQMGLIPIQADVEKSRLETEQKLMPKYEEYATGMMDAAVAESKAQKPLMEEYYKEALRSTDESQYMKEARSDVAMAYKESEAANRRAAARMGLDPNSAKFQEAQRGAGLERARMTAGAMGEARRTARDERFGKLQSAAQTATQRMQTGLPI